MFEAIYAAIGRVFGFYKWRPYSLGLPRPGANGEMQNGLLLRRSVAPGKWEYRGATQEELDAFVKSGRVL